MKKPIALALACILAVGLIFVPASANESSASSSQAPASSSSQAPSSKSSSASDASSSGLEEASSKADGTDPGESQPSQQTPSFSGGALLSAMVPQSMKVGDRIDFYISNLNFVNLAAYDLNRLTAVVTAADSTCFEILPFYKTADGSAWFSLRAVRECPAQGVTVTVTDGVRSSLPLVFTTSVIKPEPPESSSSGETQYEPESSTESGMNPENEPSSQTSSSQASTESSREPESSSEPESSQETESSSEPESSTPESSGPEEPEDSSKPEADKKDVVEEDDYVPESEDETDVFTPRAAIAMTRAAVPQITEPAENTTITDTITDVNDATVATSGTTWRPQSGIPSVSGATISNSTPLIFAIPDNNFAHSGASKAFADNLAGLNTQAYLDKVQIGASDEFTSLFLKEFVRVSASGGQAFGIKLTPSGVTAERTLPKGTTFGFRNQANPYPLPADLTIVPPVTGSTRADGINTAAKLGQNYSWVTKGGRVVGVGAIETPQAGDEYLIHFSPQFFTWDGDMPATVTLSSIRSKISLRQSTSNGNRIFEKIELTSAKGEAVVRIKYKEAIPHTREIDFKATLYMAVRGARDEDSQLYIEGKYGDEDPVEFYSEDKDIDISYGEVGKAMETIRNARVDIGNGIVINVPVLRQNTRFYGAAVTGPVDLADEEILDEYPDIMEIYTLYTLGLNGAESTVNIDSYGGYHVYDGELNYLGQHIKNLPLSTKYYLAAKQLDIAPDIEDDDDPFDDEPPEYDGYPIDGFPENENGNPATGR